jgi:hypothetical protein
MRLMTSAMPSDARRTFQRIREQQRLRSCCSTRSER